MSSGEDWTHHWLMTSVGPSVSDDSGTNSTLDNSSGTYASQFHPEDAVLDDPLGMSQVEPPYEGISTSPATSIDLDRDSPMACGIDEDDAGPPSIETQPPDNSDLEVSGITSWINSGGHYGSAHPGLGFPHMSSDLVGPTSSTNINSLPDLDNGEFGCDVAPVYGPALPVGPFNSPIRSSSPQNFGDVADDSATSGLCGLRNLGNTCFMAAGLQCLVNTPPIAQYFFNHHLESEEAKRSLAGCFSQLTHKIWSGRYSSLRPSEFKEAFGAQWRDFRDYRQHDCQEFMTLLLEALRKQMPVIENEDSLTQDSISQTGMEKSNIVHPSCASSLSSRSSSHRGGSRGSRASLSPSPPQSPQCPPSPLSPGVKTSSYEMRTDNQEDPVGLDSGAASPKSSVSSSSVDAHLISLRLQPIPEEVKTLSRIHRINTSTDDISVAGTMSCHDAESVTSDISDLGDVGIGSGVSGAGVAAVRRYNHLSNPYDCDILTTEAISKNPVSRNLPIPICDNFPALKPSVEEQPHSLNQSQSWEGFSGEATSGVAPSGISRGGHLSLVKLEDIMKETKTSNVNVLALDSVTNNEFLYDSEKYSKYDSKKLKNSVDNLSRSGLKRVKEVNLLVDKVDNSQLDHSLLGASKHACHKGFSSSGRNTVAALNKRIRLEEKNVQYEKSQSEFYERTSEGPAPTPASYHESHRGNNSFSASEECKMAEESWKKFVGDSKSAVVDTFYGQFKSSLVCSVCGHTSVTFDPFGTLSVPLPHANEIQIPVTYVPSDKGTPVRYLITLFKVSTVHELKSSLLKFLGPTENTVVIAEVFDNHIARIVEESYLTKFLNFSLRSIYAFELAQPPLLELDDGGASRSQPSGSKVTQEHEIASCAGFSGEPLASTSSSPAAAQWQACNICLEELCQTELKTHESCEDCVLCDSCIEMSCRHHGGKVLACPVCQTFLNPADLIPVAKRKTEKPLARILRVPVVFRVDTESDDNNKREMQLIGHPCLLSLPSRIHASTLRRVVERKLNEDTSFSLLLVDGRGYNCSRCLFSSHCRGCEATKHGLDIVLQAGDTLCVRFTSISSELREQLGRLQEHPSMAAMRPNEPLTLYDCLRAFSQSETLENSESWFCPKCEKKQQATKTIAVWKYPPYLIIHLERFLFHGTMSTKVDDKVLFPIDGLNLSDFVAGENRSTLLYNLYSCVCHMGVAQAGHYTALVRSPVTGDWHYFNDDCVTRQKPRDEEYSTSYLLFYHRQGTKFDLCLPNTPAFNPSKTNATANEDVERLSQISAAPKSHIHDATLPSVSSFVGPLPQYPPEDLYSVEQPSSYSQ